MGQASTPGIAVVGLEGDAGVTRDLAFISYSHADGAEWLERLRVFLKPYCRKGDLAVWADPYLAVGSRWEREIAKALRRARVGVILASPHFGASDFIAEVELPALREAADGGRLTLFCIPISSVDAEVLELADYQWARPPNEPIDLLPEPERNQALVKITDHLAALFKRDAAFETLEAADGGTPRGVDTQAEVRRPEPLTKPDSGNRGALHGVPDLPPHFVARASALAELKHAVLERNCSSVGVGASPRAGLHGQGGDRQDGAGRDACSRSRRTARVW